MSPEDQAIVYTMITIALILAAGGLVIIGWFVKLLSKTNFWLKAIYEHLRETRRTR